MRALARLSGRVMRANLPLLFMIIFMSLAKDLSVGRQGTDYRIPVENIIHMTEIS